MMSIGSWKYSVGQDDGISEEARFRPQPKRNKMKLETRLLGHYWIHRQRDMSWNYYSQAVDKIYRKSRQDFRQEIYLCHRS
jgi:hypothetical protein